MENRRVSGIVVFVILGAMIHSVSPQNTELNHPPIPCTTQAECTDSRLPQYAVCVSNFCVCKDEKGLAKNCTLSQAQPKNAAYNPAAINHPCTLDHECRLANGFCNTMSKQCVCSSGYVLSAKEWKCLPSVRSIKSSCEETKQCAIVNSTCQDNECRCLDGHHYDNNTCWKNIAFGDACKQNNECSHVEYSECNEHSVCACSKLSVLNHDGQRCLLIATEMLAPCTESIQCSKAFDESQCIDKRCECRENNHFERSVARCVSSKNLGDVCSNDYECYQDQEGGAGQPQRCVNQVCVCNENFTEEGGKCMRSGASSLMPTVFFTILFARIVLSIS